MRLTDKEIEAIRTVTQSVFGNDATVRLFGSRTRDDLRGGDIDLHIQCVHRLSGELKYRLKLKFLVELKNRIGDQKIDVLIDSANEPVNLSEVLNIKGIQI